MKSLLSTLAALLILTAAVGVPNAAAQTSRSDPGVRGKLMDMQAAQIISELKLDEKRATQFREIYSRYFKEMAAIDGKLGSGQDTPVDSLSDQQAEQRIRTEFDLAKKSIHTREKFYDEFRTVLSPSEIYRMYGIERDVRRRIMQESMHRTHSDHPGQGGAPGSGRSDGQGRTDGQVEQGRTDGTGSAQGSAQGRAPSRGQR